ncbi:MAG: hypothetical protein ACKV2Q_11080 [Planctomycetaceae bacterium]
MSRPHFSVGILRQIADDPTETIRLDTHQNRLLPDEDFVEGAFHDARPNRLVENDENRGRFLLRLLRETA